MPNIAAVLKEEILRLARKEAKVQVAALKKASAQHRRDLAELKRQVAAQERANAKLAKAMSSGEASATASPETSSTPRFSPTWLRKHRAKLGLSAAAYAKLVGVAGLTIYNWEKGKSRPRRAQLESLAKVRTMGRRDAVSQLERGTAPKKRSKKA